MVEAQQQSHSQIFGLVIGIDAYSDPEYQPLTGAVFDADAVSEFLVNSLRANPDHIRNLRDGEATRDAIIGAMKQLVDDDRIQKDDPIIIYFAGHGARSPRPPKWKDWVSQDEMIETICPVDLGTESANKDGESQNTPIPGIPDRTVAALLNQLSNAKGNNIVSIWLGKPISSASRSGDAAKLVARSIPNPPLLSADCDSEIIPLFNSRGGNIGQAQESHVLLAACGRDEVAYENPDTHRGIFTAAVLEVLRKYTHSGDGLTYTALTKELHIKGVPQTPHCFGSNNNRLVFSINIGVDPSLISGSIHKKKQPILNAGTLQGIYPGTRLAIFQSNLLGSLGISLGILETGKVEDFRAFLKYIPGSTHFPIPETFFAKETGWKIHVYSKQQDQLRNSLEQALSQTHRTNASDVFAYNSLAGTGVVLTNDQEDSELQVTYETDNVFFERADDYGTPFIGSRFPVSLKSGDSPGILKVILSAARYNHHLFTTNTKEPPLNHDPVEEQKIKLEFFTLSRTVVGFDWEVAPNGPNIVNGNVIDMVVDSEKEWGIRLFNTSDFHLYPHLFFFDAWDLTIRPWYLPEIGIHHQHHGPRIDCPLPAGKQLNIGYGDSGVLPWCFNLREGVEAEIGYLKLYLTTQPVDLRSFEQSSPFAHDEEGARGKDPNSMQAPGSLNGKVWFTRTYVVIQRRSAPPQGSPPAPQFNPPKLARITSESRSSSKTHLLPDPKPSKEDAPAHTRGKKTQQTLGANQKLGAKDKSGPGRHTLLMKKWWERLKSQIRMRMRVLLRRLKRRGVGDAMPSDACAEGMSERGVAPTDSQLRNSPTRSNCSPIKAFRKVGRRIHRWFSYPTHRS